MAENATFARQHKSLRKVILKAVVKPLHQLISDLTAFIFKARKEPAYAVYSSKRAEWAVRLCCAQSPAEGWPSG